MSYKIYALHEAAWEGDDSEVLRLLQRGNNVNGRNLLSRTALHCAAACGRISTLALLVDHGADLSARDSWDDTALHYAALCNKPAVAEWLMVRFPEADATTINKHGETPADVADREGYAELAAILKGQAKPEERGHIYVFNYFKFTSQKDFDGGKKDGDNLRRVFTNLKYKFILYENLTADETDIAFKEIQQSKGLNDVNVNIFYILSHGTDTTTFLSSDCQKIDLEKKMIMFRKDNCSAMENRPQLWFGDFCRGRDIQKGVEAFKKKEDFGCSKFAKVATEVLSHTLYFMSSSPGIVSYADKHGSCFTTTFCKMLEEGRHQLDGKWTSDLTDKLKACNNPTTASHIYHPFPGEMFYPNEFSFDYDRKNINTGNK
ncbi:unnamed protein product [Meganyctiphanes norvegica]|uniref:Caspase family p20 domain-containing protein n=1 Tax=Meganyctiphanes norvegica TaxID=48144 RepID=A0AAV2QND8_MEGNR